METFEIIAEVRTDKGKGASRRLRHANKVPAILYGAGKDPVQLSIDHNELVLHLQHEAFYSHVLAVKFGDQVEKAVLRDVQRHPAKARIMHMDLLRVSESDKIKMLVPLHFLNEESSHGVKQQGGVVSHQLTEVEVSCLPKDLPEFIEVNLIDLSVGDTLHLSNLKLPAGVELVELAHGPEHDLPVVAVHHTKGGAAAEAETGEGEGEA